MNCLGADFSCAVVISVITKIMSIAKAHNIHNNAATFVTWAAKLENHKCSSSVICEAELKTRLVIFDMGETIKKGGSKRRIWCRSRTKQLAFQSHRIDRNLKWHRNET